MGPIHSWDPTCFVFTFLELSGKDTQVGTAKVEMLHGAAEFGVSPDFTDETNDRKNECEVYSFIHYDLLHPMTCQGLLHVLGNKG